MSLDRKESLENALLELMKARPYESICVKELTDYTHVSRKTFYQYFSNKHACLESLTDRMIYGSSVAAGDGLSGERLRFWMEHRDFLEAISRNNLIPFLVGRFVGFMCRENHVIQGTLRSLQMDYDEDMITFFAAGEIFLLTKWCDTGFPYTVEEMLEKQQHLLRNSLLRDES